MSTPRDNYLSRLPDSIAQRPTAAASHSAPSGQGAASPAASPEPTVYDPPTQPPEPPEEAPKKKKRSLGAIVLFVAAASAVCLWGVSKYNDRAGLDAKVSRDREVRVRLAMDSYTDPRSGAVQPGFLALRTGFLTAQEKTIEEQGPAAVFKAVASLSRATMLKGAATAGGIPLAKLSTTYTYPVVPDGAKKAPVATYAPKISARALTPSAVSLAEAGRTLKMGPVLERLGKTFQAKGAAEPVAVIYRIEHYYDVPANKKDTTRAQDLGSVEGRWKIVGDHLEVDETGVIDGHRLTDFGSLGTYRLAVFYDPSNQNARPLGCLVRDTNGVVTAYKMNGDSKAEAAFAADRGAFLTRLYSGEVPSMHVTLDTLRRKTTEKLMRQDYVGMSNKLGVDYGLGNTHYHKPSMPDEGLSEKLGRIVNGQQAAYPAPETKAPNLTKGKGPVTSPAPASGAVPPASGTTPQGGSGSTASPPPLSPSGTHSAPLTPQGASLSQWVHPLKYVR
jgi:hypothetical protein